MKEIILYHGSKGGIKGNIKPASRSNCDFGRGFYMGENRNQAASLVLNQDDAFLYTLRVTLSDDLKILHLRDEDWLYAVLSNRGRIPEFNSLKLASKWKAKLLQYDLVTGIIADDRMNEAMRAFSRYALSDAGLYYCMQQADYGSQYAAKTPKMCENIAIVDQTQVNSQTFPELGQYMDERRTESKNIVQTATARFRGNGTYLDQLIRQEDEDA